ncbi:MAG: 50S ribosomal protein L23 [Candidatus Berkelbacteria bacterium]|nr:50S ribosomal protein L23 [Candidatus Berkelbacteria bacterium]
MQKARIEPIISEKSTRLAGSGWYSFHVPVHLGKREAASIIENNFKVKVVKIRSSMKRAKTRRTGKSIGRTKPFKKVMVKLKKGQKIDIFEVET